MATRPYKACTDNDLEYIEISKQVKWRLEYSNGLLLTLGLREQEYIDLSVMITAYFEDFINEAGLWAAFINYNEETYGYKLPFYDLRDYEDDYINREDIAFIIWHWVMIWSRCKKLQAPASELLMELSTEIYLYLEDQIEHSSATEFYDTFLLIQDEADFFEIRVKAEWLAYSSYLFGKMGFAQPLQDLMDSEAKTLKKMDSTESKLMAYDLKLDGLFSIRCKLGGLRVMEWAARVLRGSQRMREQLADLQPKKMYALKYLGKNDTHYHLEHRLTGRRLDMVRASLPSIPKVRETYATSLIQYGKAIWAQGATLMLPPEMDPRDMDNGLSLPEMLMTPAERTKWYGIADEFERGFQKTFGKNLEVFPSIAAAEAGYKAMFENTTYGAANPKTPSPQLAKQFDEGPLAMYVVPGCGISYCGYTAVVINYLQGPPATGRDRGTWANILFTKLHPVCVAYVFEHYPVTSHIGWDGLDIDLRKYWRWLSGSFNPEAGGKDRPWMGVVG
jgi:hypothetical protein